MRFSERYGYRSVRETIQLESMDESLRNSLWNALEMFYWEPLRHAETLAHPSNETILAVCRSLWVDYFKKPLDSIPMYWIDTKSFLSNLFFREYQWFEIYDFIEFIAQLDIQNYWNKIGTSFRIYVNEILQREMAGYRFVDELIAPITDEAEISEIEAAIDGNNHSVTEQLRTSLRYLTDRDNPDYRNSVKESISAVEGLVKSTLGTDQGTLGNLIKNLDDKAPLHAAFKDALSKLYGYTSDEGGIRHALLDDSRDVTFEEAKFMLVVCSAFINYVRGSVSS